jgi:hypothetical protein
MEQSNIRHKYQSSDFRVVSNKSKEHLKGNESSRRDILLESRWIYPSGISLDSVGSLMGSLSPLLLATCYVLDQSKVSRE